MTRRALIELTCKRIGGILAGAILAAACASVPPAQPASDMKAISGKWDGAFQTGGGGFGLTSLAGTLTITNDGRYTFVFPSLNPSQYAGTVAIVDGKYRYKSDSTGATGTFILHDGEGKRAIAQAGDGGGSGLYWAAK